MQKHTLTATNDLVIRTTSGQPLTEAEFIARVKKAFESAEKGKTVSSESLLAEVETW